MQTINILDIPLSPLSMEEAVNEFIQLAKTEGKKHFVATPNAEIILQAQEDEKLKTFLTRCELNFPDATSLLWAAEYKNKKWNKARAVFELLFLPIRKKNWKILPERVTGSDTFEKICRQAAQENLSIALIGGGENVARDVKQKLLKKFPALNIVATIDGLPYDEFWDEAVLKKLEGTEIIFVALGCPRQEFWIADNLEKINSARVAIGVGGTFDFYAKKIARAPKWMRTVGLEWLFRLIQEPKRWKRIFLAVFVFPWKVFKKQL